MIYHVHKYMLCRCGGREPDHREGGREDIHIIICYVCSGREPNHDCKAKEGGGRIYRYIT